MSPVSPIFHNVVKVSIGLKIKSKVGTSIPKYYMSMVVGRPTILLHALLQYSSSLIILRLACPYFILGPMLLFPSLLLSFSVTGRAL